MFSQYEEILKHNYDITIIGMIRCEIYVTNAFFGK